MKKRTLTFVLSLVFSNFVFSQTSTNKVYDLKVIAKSKKDYSISGMDNLGKVNADDPQLTFEVDSEINFFIDAQGHPFYLKLVPGVGKKNQVQNIPNNGTSSGKITWKPEKEGTYYYQCSKHKNMTGKIVILASKK
ncbi:MAG: hypothetical protein CBC56_005180 [Flavobacteriales bacterium TMED96]|nr:MAG: hypothetical protein CBC56_005180 [Flavobacteriales bacterium TMED96]|tara:strand:- start:1163 stop:1570 length:408 start_codon:yes stop_codon:yes gene_type:complete